MKPIKAAILESAAAKEILDMRGDDPDFEDEGSNEDCNRQTEGGSTAAVGGIRGGPTNLGAGGKPEDGGRGRGRGGNGQTDESFVERMNHMSRRRRNPFESFRVRMAIVPKAGKLNDECPRAKRISWAQW